MTSKTRSVKYVERYFTENPDPTPDRQLIETAERIARDCNGSRIIVIKDLGQYFFTEALASRENALKDKRRVSRRRRNVGGGLPESVPGDRRKSSRGTESDMDNPAGRRECDKNHNGIDDGRSYHVHTGEFELKGLWCFTGLKQSGKVREIVNGMFTRITPKEVSTYFKGYLAEDNRYVLPIIQTIGSKKMAVHFGEKLEGICERDYKKGYMPAFSTVGRLYLFGHKALGEDYVSRIRRRYGKEAIESVADLTDEITSSMGMVKGAVRAISKVAYPNARLK